MTSYDDDRIRSRLMVIPRANKRYCTACKHLVDQFEHNFVSSAENGMAEVCGAEDQ